MSDSYAEANRLRSRFRPMALYFGIAGTNQTHPSFGPSAPNQRSVITFFRV